MIYFELSGIVVYLENALLLGNQRNSNTSFKGV